ncbi:hypothetical protein [Odoribacter laneus]|uniref:hypothetical protein n=1 Tax=Odoribacter laneus TaxID=626933 RepID=UPI001C9C0747|nr:hypothetical protein [Odoribacter laneus]
MAESIVSKAIGLIYSLFSGRLCFSVGRSSRFSVSSGFVKIPKLFPFSRAKLG